jgi:phage I-like protein
MPDLVVVADAPDAPSEHRIKIAQLGRFKDRRYGKFSITKEMADGWKARLHDYFNGEVPIDLDHGPERGRGSEAAGWIKDIEVAEDGVYGTAEWTTLGAEKLRDRRYRYLSPTFHDDFKDEQGKGIGPALIGVALTNRPMLRKGMPAVTLSQAALDEAEEPIFAEVDIDDDEPYYLGELSSKARGNLPSSAFVFPGESRYPIHDLAHARNALARSSGKPEEAKVKAAVYKRYPQLRKDSDAKAASSDSQPEVPDLENIAKALSLEDDADEAAILEAIRGNPLKDVVKALSLDEDAEPDKVVEAIGELKERVEKAEEGQPTKPLGEIARQKGKKLLDQGDYDELEKQAKEGKRAAIELAEKRFDEAFRSAVQEGRAAPANEERFRELYEAQPAKTLATIDELPPLVPTRPRGSGGAVEVPEGEDEERHLLHRRVLAHMRRTNETDYPKALSAVLDEDEALESVR